MPILLAEIWLPSLLCRYLLFQHSQGFSIYFSSFFCRIFVIIGLLDLFPSKDNKTESESEKIRKFLCLLSEIISSANTISYVSAMKIELPVGRYFYLINVLLTAAQPILSQVFDPSV